MLGNAPTTRSLRLAVDRRERCFECLCSIKSSDLRRAITTYVQFCSPHNRLISAIRNATSVFEKEKSESRRSFISIYRAVAVISRGTKREPVGQAKSKIVYCTVYTISCKVV